MRRVTVYGVGGFDKDLPDNNVVEEYEVQDDEPNLYDLADAVIVPSKLRRSAPVVVPSVLVVVIEAAQHFALIGW